jgi:hypothetical protein
LSRSGFAKPCHVDGRLIDNRTLCLADATPDAQVDIHSGLLDLPFAAVSPNHDRLLKPDGLLRRWAVFLAHDAGNTLGIGETPALIDQSKTDFRFFLLGLREGTDGSRGTDLTTQRAIVLTVADLWNQDRRPDSLNPSLEQGRLKAIGETDFHTFPTFDASFEEFCFRHGTGGAYESRMWSGLARPQSDQRNRDDG